MEQAGVPAAAEKAGPLAHKAAGMTEQVGQRVAARSKRAREIGNASSLRPLCKAGLSDSPNGRYPKGLPRLADTATLGGCQ